MLYNKIRVDFKYGPKGRFYRIFLVREDINLFNFCVGLGVLLGSEFEHCFLITCDKENVDYVMAPFMEDLFGNRDTRYLRNYTLCALPNKFNFEYDTGEGWDFSCKKYKNLVEKSSNEEFILLEGAGMGIWEDNIGTLIALFEGKLDPNSSDNDENEEYYLPWNCEIEKFGDFDKPLDIDEINESLNEFYIEINSDLVKQEIAYIEANGIDVNCN